PLSGGSTRGMTRMDTEAKQTAGMHGHGMVMQADTVQGLAVSADGFTLGLGRRMATPGRQFQLTFRILDERGRTVRDFDVKHTKRLHLVVVRRDMIDFQHLHPTQVVDGSWATTLTLHEAGSYRVFADFSTSGRPYLPGHPDADSLKFMATFPTAGAYRLFLQFKVDGSVHTAAFTQEVSP